jgi:S-adenosylmethionine synthetase
MPETIFHAFEAGRRGKPDEIDSQIANLIGAEVLRRDETARFDLRVNGYYSNTRNCVTARIAGEISDRILAQQDFQEVVARIIAKKYEEIYKEKLDAEQVIFSFAPQSDALSFNSQKDVAGDSGTAIAVAYQKGPHYLPWERFIAVGLRDIVDEIYLHHRFPEFVTNPENFADLTKLRADGKIEVIAEYTGAEFQRLNSIVVAAEQSSDLSVERLRELLSQIISLYLQEVGGLWQVDLGSPNVIVNGAGHWPEGGWKVDAGSREAKPYRDGFSTYGVCEDSFSGEDPSKPSATASLLARYIATSIVKSNLAEFARVTLCYQLGNSQPIVNIFTNDTAKISQEELETKVRQKISVHFRDAIATLRLRRPEHYAELAAWSDYFQNPLYPWNQGIDLN